jgi:hypothetical protein
MLNPIEEFFAIIKHFIRKLGFKNKYELIKSTFSAIKLIEKR